MLLAVLRPFSGYLARRLIAPLLLRTRRIILRAATGRRGSQNTSDDRVES